MRPKMETIVNQLWYKRKNCIRGLKIKMSTAGAARVGQWLIAQGRIVWERASATHWCLCVSVPLLSPLTAGRSPFPLLYTAT